MSNLVCPKCKRSSPPKEGDENKENGGWSYSHKYDMFYCRPCLKWCTPQVVCSDIKCTYCLLRGINFTDDVKLDAIDDYDLYH